MKSWWAYRPKRNVVIGAFLLGSCVGLFFGNRLEPNLTLSLLTSVMLIIAYKKRAWMLVVACLLLGLLLGLWRSSTFSAEVNQYQEYFGRSVVVRGKVSDDPGYNEQKLIEFHTSNVSVNGKDLPGRVRIRSQNAYSIRRGDIVEAKGLLRKTLGTSRQASISYGTVRVISKNTSYIEKVRTKFFAAVFSSLPEPQASLGLGYLAGVRAALPTEFASALSVVGLTHIVAVSGYNLTILVQFVKRLFEKRSAFQTVFFSSLLLVGFLFITGWSPSITRATIIASFSLLAWYYGRRFQPIIIILLGAAITAFVNPLYIWGDVGWYLSFLAFTGVLVVAPLVLYFMGKIGGNLFMKILIETLSAQLMTAPYIASIFGSVSVISPLANILVVPFIPFAMLGVFMTGIAGTVSPLLGLWVAVPARAIMTITVWVVEKLASIPWALISLEIQFGDVVLLYGCLTVLIIFGWLLYMRRANKTHEAIDWNLL